MKIGFLTDQIPWSGKNNKIKVNGKYNLKAIPQMRNGTAHYHQQAYASYGYQVEPLCAKKNRTSSDIYGYGYVSSHRRKYVTTGHFSGTVPDDFSPYRSKDLEMPKAALPNTTEEALKVLAGQKRRRMRFPQWLQEDWAKPCGTCFPVPKMVSKTIQRKEWVLEIDGVKHVFDRKPTFKTRMKRVKNPNYNPKWADEYDKTYK